MPAQIEAVQAQASLNQFNEALESGTFVQVKRLLNSMPASDVAHVVDSSPPKTRAVIWRFLEQDRQGEVIPYLNDEIQGQFLRSLNTEEVVSITEGLEPDDVADLLQQLPDRVIQEVLQQMDQQDRQRVEHVLAYPEDTAGGIMNTDAITVRPKTPLDVVLRYLRRHEKLPEMTDNLIVVNRNDEYIGLLPLRKLLVSDPSTTVREIMVTEIEAIPANLDDGEVANLFERNDWVSAPVIDESGKLIGRITIDDVVDVIREDADHSLMSLAGLDDDEDTFATVRITAPKRAIWLGINLITALLASAVISLFEGTLEQVVALAILMPIVASMGGVAGTQTLTVVIRAMALGQISKSNSLWLISKEFMVGVLNGLCWSVIVGAAVTLWFDDTMIGVIIAAAMIINLVTAAVAGALIPLLLRKINIDPALAGGVALTTVTDVIGFLSFLGLASWFYL
jgi:magnesium transporter